MYIIGREEMLPDNNYSLEGEEKNNNFAIFRADPNFLL